MRKHALLLALVGVMACKSDAERLMEYQRESRDILDTLYTQYGGGDLAHEIKNELGKSKNGTGDELERKLTDVVGNLALEMDRDAFELQCKEVGRGERPAILNDKAKAFFARAEVGERCSRVSTLQVKIAELKK